MGGKCSKDLLGFRKELGAGAVECVTFFWLVGSEVMQ